MLSSLLSLFLIGTPGAAISGECWNPTTGKTPCTFTRYSCGRVVVHGDKFAVRFRSVFFNHTEVSILDGPSFTDQCVIGEDSINCLKTLTFIRP